MTLHISPDTARAGATASHSRTRTHSQQRSVRQEPPADQVAQGCLDLGADVVGLDGIRFTGAVPVALRLPETQSVTLEEK